MWTVNEPAYLVLLTFVLPLIYLRHFSKKRGELIPFPVSLWNSKKVVKSSRRTIFFLVLSSTAFWFGVMALIVALAGPARVVRSKVFMTRGIDIIVLVDESPSMAAIDLQPINRFEAAKQVIKQFVDGRENDPVGLIGFASEAAVRIPLTLDYTAVKQRIDTMRLMELGTATAIGTGLSLACLHLQNSTAEEKVIILLSDGENNAGDISPFVAADIARELGIRIYAIGVGSRDRVPVELVNPDTGGIIAAYTEDSYDEELLRALAQITGGRFFSANSMRSLEAIFKSIDSLVTTERLSRTKTENIPEHHSFILYGLLLILSDFFFRKLVLREVFI